MATTNHNMLASSPSDFAPDSSDFVEVLQIHQCLRNEFTSLAHLVARAAAAPGLRVEARHHFLALKAIYDSHSQVEDDIIFPELVMAHTLCEEACAELDRQHVGQKRLFVQLDGLLRDWPNTGLNRHMDEMVVELADRLRASVCLHLNLEEEELLPSLTAIRASQALLLGRVIGERSQDLMKLIFTMLERNLSKSSFNKVMQEFQISSIKTKFMDWQHQLQLTTTSTSVIAPSFFLPLSEDQCAAAAGAGGGVGGCVHYRRKLKMYFECCDAFYSCAKCHDLAQTHSAKFNKRVWCQQCGLVQTLTGPAHTHCGQCDVQFAQYACFTCNLWEDNPNVSIYHCPYCNLCRKGKGLGIDFHHCMKCNRCMSTSLRHHKCVEEAVCMICLGDLQLQPNYYSKRCGHVMHQECFKTHLQYDYRCPNCRCSLVDMDQTWNKLNEMVAYQPPPPQCNSFTRCNDCGECKVPQVGPMRPFVERGLVALRVGERCLGCGSYNTIS